MVEEPSLVRAALPLEGILLVAEGGLEVRIVEPWSQRLAATILSRDA